MLTAGDPVGICVDFFGVEVTTVICFLPSVVSAADKLYNNDLLSIFWLLYIITDRQFSGI